MNCQIFKDQLSEWIDQRLPPASQALMTQHRESCAACRALDDSLRQLVSQLHSIPQELPARDHWPAIARRIEHRSPRWYWPAAAALLLVSFGLTLWLRPQLSSSQESSVAQQREMTLPPELIPVDEALTAARTRLEGVLAAKRDRFSPETIRTVERNLRLMESACEEIRLAILQDPANRPLQEMFVASRRRQIDMIQQVTRLAALQERQP
jgi:hypothetical protein